MRSNFRQFRDIVAAWATRRKHGPIPQSEAGVTLVEMIVVLVIIAIVAGMIVSSGILSRPDQARVTVANSDLKTIGAALKMYRLDNGGYPTTAQGLKALVEKPTASPVPANWSAEGYLPQLPVDPWNNPYAYAAQGTAFTLKSYGKDGKEGGEGLDADLTAGK